MFKKLASKLSNSRNSLKGKLAQLFTGKVTVSHELLENLEKILLASDVGVKGSQRILEAIKSSSQNAPPTEIVRHEMRQILEGCHKPLIINREQNLPFVILVVGVNGAGKTTSIAKMAKSLKDQGFSIMLAAGDTFRAAAVDQINEWGSRLDIPVVSKDSGSDPASLAYEAHAKAKSDNVDVLIIDTAGRLHTQSDLMAELDKIKRVIGRQDPQAPQEVILVLDGTTGQNTITQTEVFTKKIGVSSLIVTKLDGTARGGALFNLALQFELPVRFIGVGEGIDDLLEFNANDFVNSLLSTVDK